MTDASMTQWASMNDLEPSDAGHRHTRRGVVLAVVSGVQFLLILDLAIVTLALPSIETDLGLDRSGLQWVVVAYGLTFGGFLLLGGRVADLVGSRTAVVGGLTLFTVGSLTAGLATSGAPFSMEESCR
jgi:MFS family permease